MPFKNFVDDTRLDDTDVDTYWVQQAHVIKPSDTTRTSTTTLTDDPDLVLPLLANTQYWLELFVLYGANQTADIGIGLTVPAGTTYDMTHGGLRTGHTTADGFDTVSRSRQTQATTGTAAGIHATANTDIGVIPIEGKIVVAGTAGNVAFRWAQAVSNATGTIVKANSLMIIQRLT